MPHANCPELMRPGYAWRHGWPLAILIVLLSTMFPVQCMAAEVAAAPSPASAELCAYQCAPVSTLPPVPMALPTLAFDLPHRLPLLRWVYESEQVPAPLVVRRAWVTRGPPEPYLYLS